MNYGFQQADFNQGSFQVEQTPDIESQLLPQYVGHEYFQTACMVGMDQQFQQACFGQGPFQAGLEQTLQQPHAADGAFQSFQPPCTSLESFQEPFPQPSADLDPLQSGSLMNRRAQHKELFKEYLTNKQRQESLIVEIYKRRYRVAKASVQRRAAEVAMGNLLSEFNTLDPNYFTMCHNDAWKEIQKTMGCEAVLSSRVQLGHESLKKATQEGDYIVEQLKILEMQLHQADPTFQLYDYGQVGTIIQDDRLNIQESGTSALVVADPLACSIFSHPDAQLGSWMITDC
ncbi:unnamed protein product [Clonostachys rosea]|uniref:Uncharacterized protein n=1 Tax=Bionectria ochroleuca TaxID=29856 RepID=A0ABY6UPV3_BIOOC|nr:unnamed protein product [Clonostachys rosea]